jgi:hypothetical protein
MLRAIHQTLQRLLYENGQIDPRDVDIQFEAPTRERIEQLLRPTINIFLFDMQENIELRRNNFQTTQQNGRAERRMAPRRFDLRYMVSALTSEIDDEHQLLWRVLVTFMQNQYFPDNLLHDELRTLDPPLVARVDQPEGVRSMSDLWSTLGTSPHAAFCYVITVPIDIEHVIEAPLVLTRSARYINTQTDTTVSEVEHQIGGVVHNESGEPLAGVKITLEGSTGDTFREAITNVEGRFTLRGLPTGISRLRVTRDGKPPDIVTVAVPALYAQNTAQLTYDILVETQTKPDR